MYSLIIKNGEIIDGSGKPSYQGDIAIEGHRIINIAPKINNAAVDVYDAAGKIVCPGFIDIQNHSDSYWQIFDNPGLHSLLTQGYTTILVGQCGASLAPLLSGQGLLALQKWHDLSGANINWQSFSEFAAVMEKNRFGCNIGSLVGYSTLRRGLVGDDVTALDLPDLNVILEVLEQSLNAGAFGLSSGLAYAHEAKVSELELFSAVKLLKKHNALFSVHLRNEAEQIEEALEEALDIARHTEVNLKISHLKIRGKENWPKYDSLIQKLEKAWHKNLNVHFDVYPYNTTWQVLYSYLPAWAVLGGRQQLLKNLRTSVFRAKLLASLGDAKVDIKDLIITSTAANLNVIGKTIGSIAKNFGTSSEEALLHLIENGGSEVLVFEKSLNDAAVNRLSAHPLAMIATDGGGFSKKISTKLVHPRSFGSSAKFLKTVLKEQTIPLVEAIRKLTSLPAGKAGFTGRGEIKINNYADLIVLDKNKIEDTATLENPYQFAKGFELVLVNGETAIRHDIPTKALSGKFLRRTNG